MKRLFIINPISGGGMTPTDFESVRSWFRSRTGSFHHIITKSRDDAQEQARIGVLGGYDQLVVLGGDGTLNSVVNGCMDGGQPIRKDILIAVGKWGTGSDYFRTINYRYKTKDWRQTVLTHAVRSVDLGEASFSQGGGRRYFINMLTLGMSGAIARSKESNPSWLPRRLQYIVPTVRALRQFEPSPGTVSVDGQVFQGMISSVFISKGIYAGGGMKLGGGVDLGDGRLDVKIFFDMTFQQMISRLPRLYLGNFEGLSEIKSVVGKKVTVETERPFVVETDGEVCGETRVSVEVVPTALKVCFPLPK